MITVCLPIYNEEDNVERAIQNIRDSDLWKSSPEKELLICVNGSTDQSASIVRWMRAEDPNIHLIEISQKSKNEAWTQLRDKSNPKSNILFFVDADVILEKKTLSRLNEKMEEEPSLALAGSRIVPLPEQNLLSLHRKSLEVRTRTARLRPKPFISGRCYAIRRADALTVQLPHDPRIHEDRFLQLSFYDRYTLVGRSQVHFRTPSYLDYIRQNTRNRLSHRLLRKLHPDVYQNFKQMKRANKGRKKSPPTTIREKGLLKITALLSRLAERIAERNASRAFRKGHAVWVTTPSTKKVPRRLR